MDDRPRFAQENKCENPEEMQEEFIVSGQWSVTKRRNNGKLTALLDAAAVLLVRFRRNNEEE